MLQINKAESKSWYLTLTEKTTISNPTYLFSVTQRQSNTVTNFIMTDVSSFKERYNEFVFVEGVTADLYTGEYMYKVYAQTSPSNLDPSLADELVEEGILKVGDTFGTTSYTPNLTEKIYE